MSAKRVIQASFLAVALSAGVVGCNSSEELSQEEVRFLSHIDQSKFYQRQGELQASTQEARSAIDILPHNIEPYLLIIDNLVEAGDGGSVERQVAILRERIEDGAIDQETENKLHLLLARGHYLQGEFAETRKALQAIAEPSAAHILEANLIKADVALAQRRFNDAKKAYEEARELDEQNVLPLIGLSKAAFLNGDTEAARTLVAEAEAIAEGNTELWLWKGQMAHREKRWDDARRGYEKALEDIGQFDVMTFRKYQTLTALAEVLRAQGNAQQAFVYEEILAKSGPGTMRSNFETAQEHYQAGELDKAGQALEEILAQAPTHERAQLMLGLVRFQQGRPEDAEKLLSSLKGLNNEEAERLLAATKLQLRQPEAARELLANVDENETNPGTLALVGLASLASGDDQTGRRYLEKSLDLAPDNAALRTRYASYLVSRGEASKATKHLQTAVSRSPDNEEAYLALARLQARQENYEGASKTLEQWRRSLPESPQALISSGDLAAAQGRGDQARQYYRQALEKTPDDPRPYLALANLARSTEDTQAALEHYKQALAKEPNSREALRGLIQTSRDDESTYQESLAWLEDLGEQHPKAIGPKMVLLEDALRQGNYAAAEKAADAIVALAETPAEAEPLLSSLYGTVAQQTALDSDPESASKILQQARERYPQSEPLTLMAAGMSFEQGNEEQGLDLIKIAKKAPNSSARPYLMEADFRARKGELKEAANSYTLALEKADQPVISLKLSAVLQKDNQPNKAREVLEAAAQQHPASAQVKLALAMAYQSANETEKAVRTYEALLKLAPDNAVALNNLAWIYFEQGEARAADLAQRAYELSPNSPAIADTYGWILFSQDQIDASLPVLESAHELAPSEQEIALHLVEAYKAAGHNGKAKMVLEKF